MPLARLGAGQRALILGKTESGKTHWVRCALADIGSWVIIDSKRSPEPHEPAAWARAQGAVVSADPADILRHRRVVFQVSERSLRDRAGWQRPGSWGYLWTAALRALKRRGHTVVDFNEGLATMPTNSHPEAREIFTQGAGFHLTAWVETQASNWIDTVMLRQAEVVVSFHCQAQQDRDVIARARGVDAALLAELELYWWAYHHIRERQFSTFPPLPRPRARRLRSADAAPVAELDNVPQDSDEVHEQDLGEGAKLAP